MSLKPLRARATGCLAAALLALVSAGAAAQASPAAPDTDREAVLRADARGFVIVAVDNPLRPLPVRAGTSLPSYAGAARYGVGGQAAGTLADLARRHGLAAVSAWPITALGWHCAVLALPAGGPSRDAMVEALSRDPRVRLAQPLNDFTLMADAAGPRAAAPTMPAPPASPSPLAGAAPSAVIPTGAYNDPYLPLQHGFAATRVGEAHQLSRGRDVPVALIDSGLDGQHPDLAGRIARQTDLVGAVPAGLHGALRHGTEVGGVIAAVANNRLGIVGIAPEARLEVYQACWSDGPGRPARCNSFTLAKALAAVLQSPARIVNLSLAGPPDPLLQALLTRLLQQGRLVVAALPASGRREGFPSATPEVLVVGIDVPAAASLAGGAGTLAAGVVLAPGRDVLTLVPGGGFDYASGSSIAAAHASGVAALLLGLQPGLDAASLRELIGGPGRMAAGRPVLDAQATLLALRRQTAQRLAH